MVADSGGPFDKLKGAKGREPEPGVDAEKKEVKMMSFAKARKKYKFGETFYNRTDGSSVRFIGVEGNTNKKRPRIDLNDEEKKVLEVGIYDSKSGKTNKEVVSIKRANKFLEEYTISQKDWELLDEIRKDEEAKEAKLAADREARTAESLKILKEKLMQDAQGKSTADFEAENNDLEKKYKFGQTWYSKADKEKWIVFTNNNVADRIILEYFDGLEKHRSGITLAAADALMEKYSLNKEPEDDAETDEQEAEKQEALDRIINAGEKYYNQMETVTLEGYSDEMKKRQMEISLEFFLRKIIQEKSEFFKDEFEEKAKEIAQNILTKHK